MKTTLTTIIAIAIGVALAGAATVALAARNSSGTFSYAAVAGGYPYISGQTISSSGVNANQAEVATALTDSLSRSGKGGMTAPLRCADGTAALPAFSWTSDTNTGIYRIGTDNIGISLGGTKKVDLASGLTAFTDPVDFLGSTTTTGIARFPGGIGAVTFSEAVTFASSVTVPTPVSATDAANKGYVDAETAGTFAQGANWGWTPAPQSYVVTKRSGFVMLNLAAITASTGADFASVLTLNAGYRPTNKVGAMGQCLDNGTGRYVCWVTVDTNGLVKVEYFDNGASVLQAPPAAAAGDTVSVTLTYLAGG